MIRRRFLLLAVPLCVVVVAASVAFAATPDTEHSSDAKLDKLHVVRPIAASQRSDRAARVQSRLRTQFLTALQQGADADGFAFVLGLRLAADQEFADLVNATVDAFLESIRPPAPAPRSSGYRSSGSSSSGGSAGSTDTLACIRAHESDSAGGYQAVSPGGTYRGAYQFLPSTWDSVAASSGRSDLVGVDPAAASPADQDAMASSLYASAGSQPWGGRC